MKKIVLLTYFITLSIYSQIPAGYYDTASGLTGYSLKTELNSIISNGHISQGYSALYTGYITTDTDNYYENDGTLLDMYSEKPLGVDAYNYTHNNLNCGTYSGEGDCYNREHLMPQSVFGSAEPMVSDIHHVVPSDGYVNGKRNNYPFGIVNSPTWTSTNGSFVGANTTTGYTGTVFEPIDEFKGDIARCMLYFATRYESQISSWSHDMLNGTSTQVYNDWFLTLLLDWHANDPVNQREIDRNNAAYTFQGNRNPFIDHPEYVAQIWSTTPDTQAPTAPSSLIASNITNTTVDLNWTASTDDVGVTSYEVFKDGVFLASAITNSYNVTGLTANTTYNFTVFAKDAAGNTSTVSNTETITTTNIVDTEAPSAIVDLSAGNTTSSSTDLSWTASTDNIAVSSYEIYKDGFILDSSNTNSYNVTGLTANTTYSFTVFAKDAAGNTSTVSNSINVTTQDTPSINELFISEYIEGSSNNKAIEVANFTGSSIDLSIYSLKRNANGGTSWGAALPLSGTLINGEVFVLANSAASATILGVADLTSSADALLFNGNDPVGLFKNDILIDLLGVFNSAVVYAENTTLRRKGIISSPNTTYTVSEWDSFSVDTFDGLGTHNLTLNVDNFIANLFNVYPNPAINGSTTIFVSENTEIDYIQFYNLKGQLVLNILNPEVFQNKIEINSIPTGFYIVKIMNKFSYSTKRLIVQ